MESEDFNDAHELDLLEQKIWSLYKELRDLDGAIGREIRLHSQDHQEADKAIANLCEFYERKCEITYQMAEANIYLEQTKERINAAALTRDEASETPAQERDDHLDWLKPALDTSYFEVAQPDDVIPEIKR